MPEPIQYPEARPTRSLGRPPRNHNGSTPMPKARRCSNTIRNPSTPSFRYSTAASPPTHPQAASNDHMDLSPTTLLHTTKVYKNPRWTESILRRKLQNRHTLAEQRGPTLRRHPGSSRKSLTGTCFSWLYELHTACRNVYLNLTDHPVVLSSAHRVILLDFYR